MEEFSIFTDDIARSPITVKHEHLNLEKELLIKQGYFNRSTSSALDNA